MCHPEFISGSIVRGTVGVIDRTLKTYRRKKSRVKQKLGAVVTSGISLNFSGENFGLCPREG
jgi:hypothetical protein